MESVAQRKCSNASGWCESKPKDQAGSAHAGTQAALMAASTCLAQVGMGVPGPKIPAAPAW